MAKMTKMSVRKVTVNTTTKKPVAKTTTMAPLTPKETDYLKRMWEKQNNKKAPAGATFIPSSNNFRTRSGGFTIDMRVKKP
jgi:hypothetical protein